MEHQQAVQEVLVAWQACGDAGLDTDKLGAAQTRLWAALDALAAAKPCTPPTGEMPVLVETPTGDTQAWARITRTPEDPDDTILVEPMPRTPPAPASRYDRWRQLVELTDGMLVSVDMSTGDHDVGQRVFARVVGAQEIGQEAEELMLLAEPEPTSATNPTTTGGRASDLPEHGNCPHCLWWGKLRGDGTIRRHRRASADTGYRQDPTADHCTGEGQQPHAWSQ